MVDMEKVIAWLADEELYYRDHGDTHNSLMACDAITLLKKQEEEIEQLNRFVNGFSRDAMPVVRCKDCKHRGNSEKCVLSAISEEKNFPLFILDNRGEWFCSDGERKEGR